MTKDEFAEFWDELRAAYPYDIKSTPESIAAWWRAVKDGSVSAARRYLEKSVRYNATAQAGYRDIPTPRKAGEVITKYGGVGRLFYETVRQGVKDENNRD